MPIQMCVHTLWLMLAVFVAGPWLLETLCKLLSSNAESVDTFLLFVIVKRCKVELTSESDSDVEPEAGKLAPEISFYLPSVDDDKTATDGVTAADGGEQLLKGWGNCC